MLLLLLSLLLSDYRIAARQCSANCSGALAYVLPMVPGCSSTPLLELRPYPQQQQQQQQLLLTTAAGNGTQQGTGRTTTPTAPAVIPPAAADAGLRYQARPVVSHEVLPQFSLAVHVTTPATAEALLMQRIQQASLCTPRPHPVAGSPKLL